MQSIYDLSFDAQTDIKLHVVFEVLQVQDLENHLKDP